MALTATQLSAIYPNATKENIDKFLVPLNTFIKKYGIDSNRHRLAAFLAQIGHESGELKYVVENLNYSAEGLVKVFKKYFPTLAIAQNYARKPQAIANRVYANRMGNGNEASGDGWNNRGKGLIQLTGKDNVKGFALWKGITYEQAQTYLLTTEGAVESAIYFWISRNLNTYADKADFTGLTRVINGGVNGLEHRQTIYKKALTIV